MDAPQPLPADRETLTKILDRKPVLWVGAGLSIAAGYPSTWKLVEAMAQAADDPIDTSLPFFAVADAFVASVGKGQLGELLQKLLKEPRQPAAAHRALARLAGAGCFHAIVTTNYDPLLEATLHAEGVPYLLQPLEDNAPITGEGEIRLLKIHGSYDDWINVVLSGDSYAAFGHRYPFLEKQLHVLLRQRPVLFAGCSLQDPRILDWIAALSDDETSTLKPWRALLTQREWEAALAYRYDDRGTERSARDAITRGKVRPLLLENHAALPKLLADVADRLAPPNVRLNVDLHAGPTLRASLAGCPAWTPRDPFIDPNLAPELDTLRRLADTPLPTDEQGHIAAPVAAAGARLRALAERIGDALTDALLSPEARARIIEAIGAATGGPPPLLLIRVHAEDDSDAARRRADRFLALPWELLRLNGNFPVERGALDVAREAVVDGALGLDAPDRELSVVATVAAPVDAVRLDYEGELYRLWRAMGAEERRLLLTDLGTAEALVDAVRAHEPVAMHFTGHGEPGVLLFEDDTARGAPLSVRDLVARLRGGRLPRLGFLASCYSAAVERAAGGPAGHRMVDPAVLQPDPAWSSAAELHREGIHQVIAWLGPVEDGQCTRAEEAVYAALARGRTAREAVREGRKKCREALRDAQGQATHVYPLGWAALALYHRGDDVPTALPPGTANGPDLMRRERERVVERLGGAHGVAGVERLKFGFVGRRTARAEVIRRFREGDRLVVVHGLGGLGKTALCGELAPALARELGRRDADGKPIAVRVVALDGRFAGQQADPVRALWDQVQALGEGDAWNRKLAELQEGGIAGEAVAQAVLWLAREAGGLLVYLDDAESLQVPVGDGELGAWKGAGLRALWEALVKASGTAQLALLASTRYVPEGLDAGACYPLPVMRDIDLVRLVRWWSELGGLRAEDVAWLVERIDGHPRSLQWLDAYVREQRKKLVAPGRPFQGDLRRDVIERVLPRLDAKLAADLVLPRLIEAIGEDARAHLVRCAVLEEPAPWGAVLALEDVAGTGQRLARAGLVSAFEGARGGEPRWAPHRMVVGAAGRPSGEAAREACRRVGGWFRAAWEREEGALEVAEQAARYLCAAGDGDGAWEPARRVILALRRMGRYREALGWAERALDTGARGTQRGNALAFRGQLGLLSGAPPANAEQQLREAVELVAPEGRAFPLAELGGFLRRQGRLREAVEVFESAIEVATGVKGEEHPDVAASLHSLAGVLKDQGDLPGAREHLERSLRIKAKVFGTDEHPDVAASLHELAGVLQAQGDLPGARRHLERSLRIKAKVFGTEEHPSVAASLHELAGVLQAQGDLAGAREHLGRSLRIKAKVFGTEEHPSVAASLNNLAGVLEAQGDLAGARQHLERVLAIKERVSGTREHYSTAITEVNLGALLRQLGERERGIALLSHAHRVFLSQLGPDHPYTRQTAVLLDRQSATAPRSEPPPSVPAASASQPCPCGSGRPFPECHGSAE